MPLPNNLSISFLNLFVSLRYFATFKVRKFEWLFYKVNTFLQKTTTCTELQAEQIFFLTI